MTTICNPKGFENKDFKSFGSIAWDYTCLALGCKSQPAEDQKLSIMAGIIPNL